jgi:serine protease Do
MTASNLQNALRDVVRRLRAATVHVRDRRGSGSGIVWAEGLVISNAHVVREVRPYVETARGYVRGRLLARDEGTDLAAIAVDLDGLGTERARVRDAATLRCGELVLAVGNPLGLRGAVSGGMLQHADRRFAVSDVRLAPGNSGGPLADATGSVAGVNSMVAGARAFAVSSETVRAFVMEEVARRRAA